KPFDFESSVCRPIALRISYIGTNYYGFSGTKEDTVETVEEQLFYALKTSKLIPHETKCAWAKCGRTDKGVSAFGQTVSLWIRSKLKKDDPRVCRWDQLEYVLMINRLLPPDIRVLGWSPVSPTFDARFSCTYRLYHYYFNSKYLDAEKMRLGAQKFVGTHDCRHICKLDEQKVEKEDFFTRTIMESRIEDLGNGFCRYVVKGQAFLWHQVRNMMALLFFIGEAKEQPEIIDTMLDISKHPPRQGRPTYLMAPDAPLVLYDCGFPENTVKWR
ncbi:pseudouridine synthase, partial [Gorgonomyces haynaldii]